MLTTTAALFFSVLNNEKIKLEATAASSTRNLLAAAVYQGPTPPCSVQLKGQHCPSTLGINPLFLTCLTYKIKLLAHKRLLRIPWNGHNGYHLDRTFRIHQESPMPRRSQRHTNLVTPCPKLESDAAFISPRLPPVFRRGGPHASPVAPPSPSPASPTALGLTPSLRPLPGAARARQPSTSGVTESPLPNPVHAPAPRSISATSRKSRPHSTL
ncbi:hypothetical protein GW17_00010951 [Ensete ventricosum]|nr:hypothetical protein GW17_00010951 [Ensete ventricosum]